VSALFRRFRGIDRAPLSETVVIHEPRKIDARYIDELLHHGPLLAHPPQGEKSSMAMLLARGELDASAGSGLASFERLVERSAYATDVPESTHRSMVFIFVPMA
jgi:hypothetical protein